MQVERIDGFSGDDHAYAEYLFKTFNKISLHKCTQWLEEGLTHERQTQTRVSLVRYPTPPPDKNMVVFEIWDPLRESRPSLSADQAPSKQNFDKEVERFLHGLPVSEEQWLDKRKRTGLSSANDILHAVDCLSTRQSNDDNPVISCDNVQDVAESMARRVRSLFGRKEFENISHFMSLVFTATCSVALHIGHPQMSVEAAQRDFLIATKGRCDSGTKQLSKHRSTLRWLLQEKQRQFRRGLRHRAFEMFINEGKTLRFYTRCPKDPGPNKRFTNMIPLCEVPDEIQASLPLWIPFFVKLNTGWSYTLICEALGTSLLSKEEDFQKFKTAYDSVKLAACRIQEVTPARLDQSRECVLPRRISTTGKGAAVETHGRGSDNPRSQAPYDRPDPRPRKAGLSCQSSPISAMETSSPSWAGSMTRCSSEEVRTTRFRPVNDSKDCRRESATAVRDPPAKRRKTQQSEDGRGHDGVSKLPEERRTTQAPVEDFAGTCTGQEGAFPPAVIAHSPTGSLLPSAQPTHACSELSDKPQEYSLNHTLPTYGFRHTHGKYISPFHILLAAAEQDRAATADTGRASDSGTVSREGFGPTGDPGLMVGESAQSGAGQPTSQTPRPDCTGPCSGARSYSMTETAYATDDEFVWKEFISFD